MKKAGLFVLLCALGLFGYGVKADALPYYPRGSHEVKITSIIKNIADYPDWTFFHFSYGLVYGVTFNEIAANGVISCAYANRPQEIRAIEKTIASKLTTILEDIPNRGGPFDVGLVEEKLRNIGAKELFRISCEREGKDGVDPIEETNYLTITTDLLPLIQPIPKEPLATGTITSPQPTLTPINGVCGSANGTMVSTTPTTNLCSVGTYASLQGKGPRTWICSGEYGGTSASCTAYKQSTPTPEPTPASPTTTPTTPSVEMQTSASVPPINTITTARATALQQRKYGEEILQAFTYAYEMKITTIADIDKANIWGNLTRAQAAKMLSQFAIEVLKKTPDTRQVCTFSDTKTLGDLAPRTVKACQLGIMGQDTTIFRPYASITRAELGTSLSRILFGDTYATKGGKYYTQHLQQLQKLGIMTSIANPMTLEKRGYVMLMLLRLHQMLIKI